MEFWKLVNERHCVRSFDSKEISKGKLERILTAANKAPSAGNLQGYGIITVKSDEIKEKLAKAAYNQKFIAQAPVALVFHTDKQRSAKKYGKRGEELYSVQDATIACTFAHLAVANMDLGSVWVGAFDDAQVIKILNLTENERPIAILPIGHPTKPPRETKRRKLEALVEIIE